MTRKPTDAPGPYYVDTIDFTYPSDPRPYRVIIRGAEGAYYGVKRYVSRTSAEILKRALEAAPHDMSSALATARRHDRNERKPEHE